MHSGVAGKKTDFEDCVSMSENDEERRKKKLKDREEESEKRVSRWHHI